MNRKIQVALIVLCASVFAVSAGVVVSRWLQYSAGEKTYAEAEKLASVPDFSSLPETETVSAAASASLPMASSASSAPPVDPYAEELRNMNFAALRKVNSQVVGWIVIPGTVISYPLLQGSDNQYYLSHTWNKEESAVGSIFLEHRNKRDLSDFNTIIYGHHMNNGSMFAALRFYKDRAYWAAHPYVYVTDDAGSHKYEIFASYEVSTQGDTYQLAFSGNDAKRKFLSYCADRSAIRTGVMPTANDRILTLSTCVNTGHATRWVVQALLKGSVPSDAAKKTRNKAPASSSAAASAVTAPR